MKKYEGVVQDDDGNIITSATITVKDYVGGATSSVYASDLVGTNVNGFTNNSDGTFEFYAKDGVYSIEISKPGITTKVIAPVIIQELTHTVSALSKGCVFDGVTDDTAGWIAAVAACVAAGGGTIVAPPGRSTVISSDVTISNSNVRIHADGLTVKLTGAASFSAFNFAGTTLSSPTLGSNAAIYATSVSLSALGGVAAGGWLMFNKTTPSGGGAYRFISKVRSVSGSGPYTVVLATALPIAFNTADTGLELRCISPLENVGVTGNVKFDGSAATGTTVHGIKALYCVNSRFSGISGVDCDAGAVLWAPYGHGNVFDDSSAIGCGSSSFGGLDFDGQTASHITNHRVLNGTAFGVHVTSSNYCTIANLIGEAPVTGRGVKFQSCLENTISNLQGHGATAANGVAVSVGSCRNSFHGINANGNATLEGLWLSEQDNCDNYFFGVIANGNGSRDIFIGTSDLRNMFFGVKAANIYINGSNSTCLFFGLNGAGISSGISGTAPVQIVGARDTGFTAMTGTPNESTAYDTATVTLAQLAGRVAALQAALTAHGLIGA